MALARFAEIWTSAAYPPASVAEEDLNTAERRLGVRLPEAYRREVLQVGLPSPTIALLGAIVERQLDLESLGDFYTPDEIVEVTESWRDLGMPDRLIAFASDGGGNQFCFDTGQLVNGSAGDAAVWFYDHDFGAVREIASSFDDWIQAFCTIEPLSGSDATS